MISDKLLEYAVGCFRLAEEASERRTKIVLQRVGLHLIEAAELIWHRKRTTATTWSVRRAVAGTPPHPPTRPVGGAARRKSKLRG
jgi:hypothetical protein